MPYALALSFGGNPTHTQFFFVTLDFFYRHLVVPNGCIFSDVTISFFVVDIVQFVRFEIIHFLNINHNHFLPFNCQSRFSCFKFVFMVRDYTTFRLVYTLANVRKRIDSQVNMGT